MFEGSAFSRPKERKLLLSCVARRCNTLHNSLISLELHPLPWLSLSYRFISVATYANRR
jgi:hypothetical protein